MAFRIIWSQLAAGDLKEIVRFIAQDSQPAALKLANHIFSAIEQASDMPKANRIAPEKEDESIREIILRHYRLSTQLICTAKPFIF
jgi:plasmid stabilization system protein ParE